MVNGEKLFITNIIPGRTIGLVCIVEDKPAVLICDLPPEENDNFQIVKYGLWALKHTYNRGIKFKDFRVPAENLIGEEGKGFGYILDGMNAERILIASECIGDARWFIDRATSYAREREVFGAAIGKNQGIQFPIARAYVQTEAAALMVDKACRLFDASVACGSEANMSKLLAADASWFAADMCLQTHGGYGFTVEYDIERKFRETRLYQVAPISTNLILSNIATHVLGLPKSF